MTMTRAKVLAFIGALAGIVVAALVFSAPARADTMDEKYVNILASQGIASMDGSAGLIRMGHLVCEYRAEGVTGYQVAQWVISKTNLDTYHAGYLIGAAEAAYCPSLYDGASSTV